MTTLTLLNSLDSGGEHTANGVVDPSFPAALSFVEPPPQETRFVCSSNVPDSADAVVERSAVATRTITYRRLRSVVDFVREDE